MAEFSFDSIAFLPHNGLYSPPTSTSTDGSELLFQNANHYWFFQSLLIFIFFPMAKSFSSLLPS